jgi:hypothetical protein
MGLKERDTVICLAEQQIQLQHQQTMMMEQQLVAVCVS